MLDVAAERCGGFDWQDEAFDSAYAEIELSLFGTARSYAALAPLVGLSAGDDVELGGGIRVRAAVAGEISRSGRGARPDAARVRPRRRPAAACSSSRASSSADEGEPPGRRRRAGRRRQRAAARDRRRDRGRARSSSSGSTSARCGSRRCCRSPPRSRTARRSGSTRSARRLAADLRERLQLADDDRELGEALDRWELSLFAEEPFRSARCATR